MSHLVKLLTIIHIGVPFPEEAPGTDSQNSKYLHGLTKRRPVYTGLDCDNVSYDILSFNISSKQA